MKGREKIGVAKPVFIYEIGLGLGLKSGDIAGNSESSLLALLSLLSSLI
jgi:hypothetical protein